jgi:lysozyme
LEENGMKKKFNPAIAFGIPLSIATAAILCNEKSASQAPQPQAIEQRVQEPISNNTIDQIQEATYAMSDQGLDFVKDFESLRTETYLDQGGKPTICYGHLINPNENFGKMNEEDCSDLMRKDMLRFENAVRDNVEVDLTQNQYDALVSFSYNVGTGAFIDSTLLRKLNSRDYEGAADELDRWNKVSGKVSRGLVARRAKEKNMFENGIYDSRH